MSALCHGSYPLSRGEVENPRQALTSVLCIGYTFNEER
jgi:hypothetical protein